VEEAEAGGMSKLREAIKSASLTQILLFVIAVLLLLIWLEMTAMNKSLHTMSKELDNPIGVDIQQH
jgi:hypothetical protein